MAKGHKKQLLLKLPLLSRFEKYQETGGGGAASYLSKDELYCSILENLTTILEERNRLKLSDEAENLTSVNFGIPDITPGKVIGFDVDLKRHIQAAIIAFEPRLTDVVVVVNQTDDGYIDISVKAQIASKAYTDMKFFLKIKHSGIVVSNIDANKE
jgi:predicted component of type VI protein secretion system